MEKTHTGLDECLENHTLVLYSKELCSQPTSGFLDRSGQEMQSSDKWIPENDAAPLEPPQSEEFWRPLDSNSNDCRATDFLPKILWSMKYNLR